MMSSKKEEERNEKIIRGLMKLPPNRRCINCDSLGPQYVCTNFWTFVCVTCSGIHREFTHRVKSVSMAKFSAQEVEALQKGGNQRAREIFLNDWDSQRMRLPNSSNIDKIREFIKNVYIDKKYAGGRSSSDKPPRDTQSLKNHEDHRRASSYHSFSQSPPNEHQYEDRLYGKQTGMLSRKPGSDRGRYEGKMSSFMYSPSPGHQGEKLPEDRFANEISGSRISDYSMSSTGDPFRSDVQSPNFQSPGYNSPPLQQVRDILIEEAGPRTSNTHSEVNDNRDVHGIPHPQRTTSSGSFGSLDGNTICPSSGSLIDIALEPEHASGTQQRKTPAFSSSHLSASVNSTNLDLFNLPSLQQSSTSLAPSTDLFADINHQPSSIISSKQNLFTVPCSENVGWATFDLPHHARPVSETNKGLPSVMLTAEETPKGNNSALSSMQNNFQWIPEQNSAPQGSSLMMADQWHMGLHVKRSDDPKNSQSWNAFGDSTGNVSQISFGNLPQNSGTQVLVHKPPASVDPYINLKVPEVCINNGFQKSSVVDKTLGLSIPFNDVAGSSFSPPVAPLTGAAIQEFISTNPFDLPYESDPEAINMFVDMKSLQTALPNSEMPTTLLDGFSQTWFSQGDLAYMAGQVPGSQLQNTSAQGPVASFGGNPFA